jgi:hypothetical protein
MEAAYFLKLRDVDLTFVTDDRAEATGLEMVVRGFRLNAKKIR